MIQFTFILVKPEDDRNIGAVARSMNTMGHQNLRLVKPKSDHLSGRAKALGHGSHHILEAAQCYETLGNALHDIDLAIATTARHRIVRHHYLSLRDLPEKLRQTGESLKHVALVFGGETAGLSNEDIAQCDLLTSIPQASLHPSLNLAQAVMIYSYVLSEQQTTVQIEDQRLKTQEMPPQEYRQLKALTLKLMKRLGINERNQNYVIKGLARLNGADLYLIHMLRSRIDHHFDTLEHQAKLHD